MSKRSLLLVPSLLALSPLADAAVEVSEGDLSLKFGGRIQARVEMANGTNADDSDYGPSGGEGGEIDFALRRWRITTKGKYLDNWKFVIDLEGDKVGLNSASGSVAIGIEEASLTYDMGDTDIKFGHYKAWYNMADKISSGSKMFMEDAPNDIFEGSKGVGIGVKHDAGIVRFGVDLKNQDADDGLDSTGGASNGDYQLTARVETGLSEEQSISKLKESHAGDNEGFKHNLGFELGLWTDDDDTVNGETEANVFGIDYIAYIDQLTVGAYLTVASVDDGSAETDSQILTLFAGYAIPSDDIVYEPAIRLAMIDRDTDNDDETGDPENDGGWDSGTLIDLVCNIYQKGHKSKTQIGLELWSAEEGDGDSTIFRVQQTLSF